MANKSSGEFKQECVELVFNYDDSYKDVITNGNWRANYQWTLSF